jgi:syntaxin 16
MATRNLTAIYLHERAIKVGKSRAQVDTPKYGDDQSQLLSGDIHLNVDGAAPEWVDTVEKVRDIEAQIKKKMDALRELHTAHLKPRFDSDKDAEEREIEKRTDEIKVLFRKGEIIIRQLLAKEGDIRQRPADEQKLLNNVQISLVTSLSERSKEFQDQHRKYALEVQRQRRRMDRLNNHSAFKQDEEAERREEMMQKYVDKGFTQEQIDTLLINEQLVAERDTELQRIYHNITDLHSMFQDLNSLVIDQGTLLDRIDHNVEETREQIKRAAKELEATANYAKKSKFLLIVMLLVAIIILMLLGLVLKVTL